MGDLDYGTLFIVVAALLMPSVIILIIFSIIRARRSKMHRRRIPMKPSSKPQKAPAPATKKRKS